MQSTQNKVFATLLLLQKEESFLPRHCEQICKMRSNPYIF